MIDWLTLSIDASLLPEEAIRAMEARQSKICKIDPDGEVVWTAPARESIRSDSHQLTVKLGSFLTIQGSPARVDSGNNVFGSSDIIECAHKMIKFASDHIGIKLPLDVYEWKCTRIDFNQNYFLGDAASVRQALNYLRNAEGGRYQVRTSSETINWGGKKSRRSGKIYHKGPHLLYQIKKGQAKATPGMLELAQSLIRLEIKLNNQFLKDEGLHWSLFTEKHLINLHHEYFSPLIGDVEVFDMKDSVLEKIKSVTSSNLQATRAYGHWLQIQQIGYESWKELIPRATFYRYKKILLDAGLSYSDFQASNIVPIRRKPIILGEPVTSWDQLKKLSQH